MFKGKVQVKSSLVKAEALNSYVTFFIPKTWNINGETI